MPRLSIFDLDATLWDGEQLFKDVLPILEYLRKRGDYIYIATFNNNGPGILNRLGILNYFRGGAYGKNHTKFEMIQQIIKNMHMRYGLSATNIVFYDDLKKNINEVSTKSNGYVNAIYTPNGLTWDLVV